MKQVSNAPIKVLMIGMHDQIGGIENFIMNHYRNINKNSFQLDFISPYSKETYFEKEINALGGTIYHIPIKETNNFFMLNREITRILRKNHYDIIHCNDTGLGYFYLRAAKKCNVPVRIAHSHASSSENTIKGLIKTILMKAYVNKANVYFSCSELAGKYMFSQKSFQIILNGIDPTKYRYNSRIRNKIRDDLHINKNDIVLGNIARLSSQKNQLFALKVMSELPQNYKMIIIGEGELKSEIIKKIEKLNLNSRIILLPPTKKANYYYNAFDIYFMPSLFEGLPLTGIEAQFNGLPCVFSDRISKEVRQNGNVMFVSLDDTKNVINAIKDAAKEGRTRNVQTDNYDIKKCTKKLEKYYYEAVYND